MKRKNYLALCLIIISVFFNMTVVRAEDTTDVTSVDDVSVTETTTDDTTITCGEITDIPKALPIFTSNVVTAIKIFIPIILIIMGMLDMGKAMAANDEKAATEARNKFIRRVIAAVIVFLSFTIVQFALSALGAIGNEGVTGLNLFINGTCSGKTTEYESCIVRAEASCSESCPGEGEGGNSCISTCMTEKEEECYMLYEAPEVCYMCDHTAGWAVRGNEPSSSGNCNISYEITKEEDCIFKQ